MQHVRFNQCNFENKKCDQNIFHYCKVVHFLCTEADLELLDNINNCYGEITHLQGRLITYIKISNITSTNHMKLNQF